MKKLKRKIILILVIIGIVAISGLQVSAQPPAESFPGIHPLGRVLGETVSQVYAPMAPEFFLDHLGPVS